MNTMEAKEQTIILSTTGRVSFEAHATLKGGVMRVYCDECLKTDSHGLFPTVFVSPIPGGLFLAHEPVRVEFREDETAFVSTIDGKSRALGNVASQYFTQLKTSPAFKQLV